MILKCEAGRKKLEHLATIFSTPKKKIFKTIIGIVADLWYHFIANSSLSEKIVASFSIIIPQIGNIFLIWPSSWIK